jgi:hypothetical protein
LLSVRGHPSLSCRTFVRLQSDALHLLRNRSSTPSRGEIANRVLSTPCHILTH